MRVILTVENGRYVMKKEHSNVITLEEIARLRKEKIMQREADQQHKQRLN